ncbi:MAG TPA: hypothetical protein VKR60_03645 [Candidatus Sulfotelmatobacter sp.]|nr:hypothetical protein [Candidatus Sulfotelmatobacter sp.]
MTAQANYAQPPRAAIWLVNQFASGEAAESILGDLLEEFFHLTSKSGAAFAGRWFWRQSLKTVAQLAVAGFRAAPWSTAAAVAGGFLLDRFLHSMPDKALSAVTDRYLLFWSSHFQAYLWLLNGMVFLHLASSLLIGCMVALTAKGRELIATLTLVLVFCAMMSAAFFWIAMHRPVDIPWMLWSCADPFAIVAGGAIVRTRRSAATSLTSAA